MSEEQRYWHQTRQDAVSVENVGTTYQLFDSIQTKNIDVVVYIDGIMNEEQRYYIRPGKIQ